MHECNYQLLMMGDVLIDAGAGAASSSTTSRRSSHSMKHAQGSFISLIPGRICIHCPKMRQQIQISCGVLR